MKDRISLCLLEAFHMAPIATEQAQGTHFGVQSHRLWSPRRRLNWLCQMGWGSRGWESKAFLLQTELGSSVSEPLANFWTQLREFVLHMAAITSTLWSRMSSFKASCAALGCFIKLHSSGETQKSSCLYLSKKLLRLTLLCLLSAQNLMSLKV